MKILPIKKNGDYEDGRKARRQDGDELVNVMQWYNG
jgi:hypothetical protein